MLYGRPELLMQCAWTLNYLGEVMDYERPLSAAEQLWREEGNQVRLGEALNLRADFAAVRGDSRTAAELARQALDLLPEDQEYHRGMSWLYVGAAAFAQGEMETARAALNTASTLCRHSGNTTGLRLTTLHLAQVHRAQGRLPEAARLLEGLIDEPDSAHTYEGLAARLCQGAIWREWNRLDEAESALRGGLEVAEATGQVVYLSQSYLYLALILWQKGDAAGMHAALSRQASLADEMHDSAGRKRGAALRAQLAVLSGNLESAQSWRESVGVAVGSPISYADEAECLALIRLLVRLGADDARRVVDLTEKLQDCAQAQQRTASLIEIAMVHALALCRLNDASGACDALERSLSLAQPGGYRRLYLDEGQPLAELLAVLVRKPSLSPHLRAYAIQLLTLASHSSESVPSDSARHANLKLIEPLTPREIEVLFMIQAGLSNREIAEKLYLTLNTVKVHAKNIFAKLDVTSRTQAVRRAEELGLI